MMYALQSSADCNDHYSSPEEKHRPNSCVFDTDGSNNTKILHFNNNNNIINNIIIIIIIVSK